MEGPLGRVRALLAIQREIVDLPEPFGPEMRMTGGDVFAALA